MKCTNLVCKLVSFSILKYRRLTSTRDDSAALNCPRYPPFRNKPRRKWEGTANERQKERNYGRMPLSGNGTFYCAFVIAKLSGQFRVRSICMPLTKCTSQSRTHETKKIKTNYPKNVGIAGDRQAQFLFSVPILSFKTRKLNRTKILRLILSGTNLNLFLILLLFCQV